MTTPREIRVDAHRRYPYSAISDRPTYEWPQGRRLALHLSLNIEHFRFGAGIGNDYAVPQPGLNVRSYGWRDYGNRVGAMRLLDLADAYGLRYGLLVNSDVYAYCPGLIERFSGKGHEIVGHGRTNSERQIDMSEEEEIACIREATDTIRRREGTPPRGWLAPYICQTGRSLDLLKEYGYEYMMDWPIDDQPVWFDTRHGRILSIPYSHDLNDSIECVSRRTPSQLFCDNLIDQFDEMLEESRRRPLVMCIVLHSFILGQPYRLRQFRKVVEHIVARRDEIWLATPGEIADHVKTLPPGTVPGDGA
ncbi:polysaccharide deacetylase family protein [Castellaniella sp.]|uniref:polysaccharide deacetylase family protein n=1 Tax=Castellaniella sp. TaxID=1955812 RepID=UPI002AFECA68|nr:polysaccharide deacetylase family protein [Castellaniella sp.]